MGNVHRSEFRRRRRDDALATKAVNRVRKESERIRRDARMLSVIRAGSLPFTPPVMSWLSAQLDKPARKITPEDVQQFLA